MKFILGNLIYILVIILLILYFILISFILWGNILDQVLPRGMLLHTEDKDIIKRLREAKYGFRELQNYFVFFFYIYI